MKHGVAGKHLVENAGQPVRTESGAEFRVPVDAGGDGVQHGGVELDRGGAQAGDVQLHR